MSHPTCSDCKFWLKGSGECRLNPPDHVKRFPVTLPDEWCGQHQSQKNEDSDGS